MITPDDPDYQHTKRIKQGQETMAGPLVGLARWIENTYQTPVLNVRLEPIKNGPRLNIIFEHRSDFERLQEDFLSIRDDVKTAIKKICHQFLDAPENLSTMFIVFSAFAPVARAEANGAIPQTEINALQQRLALNELWKISRNFGATNFMLYTDEQVKQFKANGMDDRLAQAYFDILKPYDEFDYFKRDTFAVYLDSKENFDKNYDSNWYFYYK